MNYLELINVQIKQCKLKDSQLRDVSEKLQTIGKLYIKFTELNLKNENVDSKLKEIQQLIQKLIDHYQSRRYRFFFDSEKSRLINELPYQIGLLLMNLQNKEKQLETLTTSDLRRQSIIQAGSITREADIILTHSSMRMFETRLSFEFQEEEDQNQVFSLYVKREPLFYKLMRKVEFHDDQNKWHQYFDLKLDKKDKLFFYIFRHKKEKINKIFAPDQYFVLRNSYKIYLCSGMKIICGEAREINVADCSPPKFTKVHEQFQSNCSSSSSQKGSINAPGYNYIKFEYLTLQNTYEFYLKNQNIDLEEYMPGIGAILCNDEKGFYLTCKENEEIKLLLYNELVTNSTDLPFCIQLSKECTMEVRFNKENSQFIEMS